MEKASLATRLSLGWGCGGGEANQVVSAVGFLGPAWPSLVAKEQPPLSNQAAALMGPQNSEEELGWVDWAGEDGQASSTPWPGPVARGQPR